MKKLLSIFIILVFAFQLVALPTVSAASEEEINLIYDLGIVPRPQEGGLFPKTYTRGDFAKSLDLMDTNSIGDFSVETAEQEVRATDIFDDENYIHIVQALSLGYMSVDNNGAFNPSGKLTLLDAEKAFVKLLGYDEHAKQRGGDQNAYTYVANKLGLLKGIRVKDSQGLSYAEVTALIANAMQVSFFSEGNVDLGGLCFFDMWRLTKREGKILANSNLGLIVGKMNENYINIDGKAYYTELLVDDSLIGAEVIYYTTNGDNDEEVVSITVKKALESVTLDTTNIDSITKSGSVIIIKDTENEKYQIPMNGYLLVNGITMSPTINLFEDFKNNSGILTLLDSDNNGSYDIVNMTIMLQDIIEGISITEKAIVTRYSQKSIELEKIETSAIYFNKKKVELSDLKEGMVIGIAADSFEIEGGHIKLDAGGNILYDFSDKKTKLVKIYASARKAEGLLDGASEDTIFIDDIEYELGNSYYLRVNKGDIMPFKLGEYVSVYMDYFGNVAYYELDSEKSLMKYGYLLKSYCGTEGIKDVFQIKLLEQDGNISTYSANDKIVLDGKKLKLSEINDTEKARLTNHSVIRYRVVDGILKEVDTIGTLRGDETAENSLTKDFVPTETSSDRLYTTVRNNVIGRKYAISSDCVIFVDASIEGDPEYDDDFYIGTASSFSTTPYLEAYDADKNREVSCIVYYPSYGMSSGSAQTVNSQFGVDRGFLVNKVRPGQNKNGDEGYWLYLVGYDGESKYFVNAERLKLNVVGNDWSVFGDYLRVTKQDVSQFMQIIQPGDVIHFKTTADDEIYYIDRAFSLADHRDATYGTAVSKDAETGKSGLRYGFVKAEKQIDNFLVFSAADKPGEDFMFGLLTSKENVPVYYISEKTAKVVPIDELPTAATGKNAYVYMKVYNYGQCFDHIFYVFD